MASDEDEHAGYPCEYHKGVTIPSPSREGISLGKQHLSSQDRELLSRLRRGSSGVHGHFLDESDETVHLFVIFMAFILPIEATVPKSTYNPMYPH